MTAVNAATTNGFLFADLRDYTRFVETHGDDAAAALLGRYRALVRAVVGQFGGAEIRTEGDSFYVVFPSASSAVLGGLAILAAATEATRTDPTQPLKIGIGVHAGETADAGEGPVGSAVNIAARVCAQARAGELLVTDTVRSLTRTRLNVRFTPRGSPSLKGIREPIALFAVQMPAESIVAVSEAAGTRRAARMSATLRTRPAALWALSAAAAAAVLIAVAGGTLLLASPKGSASPSSLSSPSVNPSRAAISSLPTMADVPFYRVDTNRSSIYPGPGPIAEPQVAWQTKLGAPANFVPIVVDDKVIVGDTSGVLSALDARTGLETWHFLDKNGGGFSGSAAGANGLIFVADLGGTLFGLDAATGEKRWTKPLPNAGVQPIVADGRLYVGSSDGHAYGFDPLTGDQQWDWTGPAGTHVNVSVVSDGIAYIGGGGVLYAIRIVDRTYAWPPVKTAFPDQSAAVLAGDTIFWAGRVSGQGSGSELLAIDRASGKVRWRWSSPSGQQVSPSLIRDGIVYAVIPDDGVYALRDKGTTAEQVWHAPGPGSYGPVSLAGDILYLQEPDGPLVALSVTDGLVLWQTPPPTYGWTNPVVTGGMIFQVDRDLGVIRGWAEPGVIALLPSPSVRPSATASPTAPPLANLIWHETGPDAKLIPTALVRSPDSDIWATDPYNDRFAIFKPDGTFVEYWGRSGSGDGQFQLQRANGDGAGGIAFESDGSFFVLDAGNGRVEKFDAQRRYVGAWGSFGDSPRMYRDPVAIAVGPDRSLYVLDDVRGVIERYDRNGKVLGSFDAFVDARPFGSGGGGANALAVDAHGNLYVSDTEPRQVERFDPTGKLTMTIGSAGTGPGQFQEQPGSMAIDSDGRVYVDQGPRRGASPGVLVFDRDGHYLTGFGTTAAGPDQISWPTGLLLDGTGNLYVGDAAGQEDRSVTSWLLKFRLLPPLAP